jgi:thermostable 8-oxoguanine DNA glycosylase
LLPPPVEGTGILDGPFIVVAITINTYQKKELYLKMDTFSKINMLWDSNEETMWMHAFQHYYDLLSPNQVPLECKLEQVNPEDIRALSTTDFYSFLHEEYYIWKYTQKNRLATTRKQLERYISENRMFELEFIQHRLFASDRSNARECLSVVSNIRGLGAAGASGLLAILFPHDFGTVDQFVVKSLLEIDNLPEHKQIEQMNPTFLKIDDGVILIDIMRKKAQLLNQQFSTTFWTPRKIDMILWSIGR